MTETMDQAVGSVKQDQLAQADLALQSLRKYMYDLEWQTG